MKNEEKKLSNKNLSKFPKGEELLVCPARYAGIPSA